MSAPSPREVEQLLNSIIINARSAHDQYTWAHHASFNVRVRDQAKVKTSYANPTESLALQNPSRYLQEAYDSLVEALACIRDAEGHALRILDHLDGRHTVEPLSEEGWSTRENVKNSREARIRRLASGDSYGEG